MSDNYSDVTYRKTESFQSDLRCTDEHDIERARFDTGPRLYGRVQSVWCRCCGELLSTHITRDPRIQDSDTEQ